MTREESAKPFAMLQANWNFLNMKDEVTVGIWFEALKQYDEAEVRQGVLDSIENINHTPVVAEVLEYVKAVHEGTRRRQAEQEDARRAFAEAVKCKACNDHGFINIIYPSGHEAIRPCTCQEGRRRYGDNVYALVNSGMPKWRSDMLFGSGLTESDFKLVRVSPRRVPTGEKYRSSNGNMMDVLKLVYVPYQPSGRKNEEVYGQYMAKQRKRDADR